MAKIYTQIPDGYGECPVCNGTGQHEGYYCRNCGGQRMYGIPKGLVRLNKQGVPCKHNYKGQRGGNCYVIYTCTECGDHYDIDSGG